MAFEPDAVSRATDLSVMDRIGLDFHATILLITKFGFSYLLWLTISAIFLDVWLYQRK